MEPVRGPPCWAPQACSFPTISSRSRRDRSGHADGSVTTAALGHASGCEATLRGPFYCQPEEQGRASGVALQHIVGGGLDEVAKPVVEQDGFPIIQSGIAVGSDHEHGGLPDDGAGRTANASPTGAVTAAANIAQQNDDGAGRPVAQWPAPPEQVLSRSGRWRGAASADGVARRSRRLDVRAAIARMAAGRR